MTAITAVHGSGVNLQAARDPMFGERCSEGYAVGRIFCGSEAGVLRKHELEARLCGVAEYFLSELDRGLAKCCLGVRYNVYLGLRRMVISGSGAGFVFTRSCWSGDG